MLDGGRDIAKDGQAAPGLENDHTSSAWFYSGHIGIKKIKEAGEKAGRMGTGEG